MQLSTVFPEVEILNFDTWTGMWGFGSAAEINKYSPPQVRRWLQFSLYPMFYRLKDKALNMYEFPKVLKTDGRYPKYVIDTEYFTIVFLMRTEAKDVKQCWEVSVHIKDPVFCNEKLEGFKTWLFKYYSDMAIQQTPNSDMPKDFLCKNIWSFKADEPIGDFSAQFWNEKKDDLLFKLFDTLRLY